jgi:ATP-dependent Lon protease
MPAKPAAQAPERVLLLPVRSTVVFPQGATALQIGYEPNVAGLNAHPEPDLIVGIVSIADETSAADAPLEPESMQKVAVLARLLDRLNLPGGTIQTTLQGLHRVRLEDVRMEEGGYYTAAYRRVEEVPADEAEAERLIEKILGTVVGVAAKVERIPNEVPRILRMNLSDPSRFADLAASLCHFNVPDRDAVLQRLDVADRLRFVLEQLEDTWERVQTIEEEDRLVGNQAAENTSAKTPLRPPLADPQAHPGPPDRAGRDRPGGARGGRVLRRVERAGVPARVAAVARRETERLRAPGTSVTDATEIRNYLELLLAVPWNATSGTREIDLDAVERAMTDEHLGLEEAKRRVLEVLAVARLRGELNGLIPCIVGPPGVGKATLASAIARGLGRPLARLELAAAARRSSWARGAPAPARSRASCSPPSATPGCATRCSCWRRWTSWGWATWRATRWRPWRSSWTPRRATASRTATWTCRWTCRTCSSSPRPTTSSASPATCATTSSRSASPGTRRKTRCRSPAGGSSRAWRRSTASPRTRCPSRTRCSSSSPAATRATPGWGNLRRSLSSIFRWLARAKAEGEARQWEVTREMIEEVLGYPRYNSTAAESAPEVGVVTGLAWTAPAAS